MHSTCPNIFCKFKLLRENYKTTVIIRSIQFMWKDLGIICEEDREAN